MCKLLTILLFCSVIGNGQVINACRYYVPLSKSIPYYNPTGWWVDATKLSSYSGSGTTWTDISGSANNGTLVGSPTFNSSAPKSFTFNGTNQYVSTAYQLLYNSNPFSVGAWINYTSSQQGAIFSFRTGSNPFNQFDIFIAGDKNGNTTGTKIVVFGGNRQLVTSSSYNDGNWHYVVATKGVNYDSLYVDGYFNSVSNSSTAEALPSGYIYVGQLGSNYSPSGTFFYNGKISDVEVYSSTISAANVLNNWVSKKTYYGR